MWAEEGLNVKRQQWNQSVHTCLLVMYGMFTQRSPTGARHSAPGSLRNHNSPGQLVKRGLLCGVHQTLSWDYFVIGVEGAQNFDCDTGCIPLCSFLEETSRVPRQEKGSVISALWMKPQRFPHTQGVRKAWLRHLPGALNVLKLMLTSTKWMMVGQFFSPFLGLKT